MKLQWLTGLLLLATSAYSQTMMTKVIQLNYLQSNNVIQMMQPLIQPGEKLSGSGQTLIVKVTPETLTQIRDVLHKLDVPPVTFNITIYQGDPEWLSVQNNNSVVYRTQSPSEVQQSQSIRVMSGESALISTGQEVPIVSALAVGFQTGIAYEQHEIKNGLLVQPVLEGSQVKLTLKRLRQQQNAAGGQQFDNQQWGTTVMAPLDKWVPLGTAEGVQTSAPGDTSYTAGRPFSNHSTLYIKVSLVAVEPHGPGK